MPADQFSAPHARLHPSAPQTRFLAAVLDRLWQTYRARVEYVRRYEEVMHAAGATFVNDHAAFRTFAAVEPACGIASVSRLFEALGYRPAAGYSFPDKLLAAVHFEHDAAGFPKLFISELQTWRLPAAAREIVERSLQTLRPALTDALLARLAALDAHPPTETEFSALLAAAEALFETLPWNVPQRQDVRALHDASQYAAWVLVHGYRVNHFTALINSQRADGLGDIEQTAAALRAAGVPMKTEIEGAPGSKLRQTATEAATLPVAVRDGDRDGTLEWSYAYFELAERGTIRDSDTGELVEFAGFLGPQATQLFEMTRRPQ